MRKAIGFICYFDNETKTGVIKDNLGRNLKFDLMDVNYVPRSGDRVTFETKDLFSENAVSIREIQIVTEMEQ